MIQAGLARVRWARQDDHDATSGNRHCYAMVGAALGFLCSFAYGQRPRTSALHPGGLGESVITPGDEVPTARFAK